MKGSRFSEEQIVGVLKEAEAGVPMKDLCRRIGISEATFYHWKAKYGGLEARKTPAAGEVFFLDFPLYRTSQAQEFSFRWPTKAPRR